MHRRSTAASTALALAAAAVLVGVGAAPASAAPLPDPVVIETFDAETTANVGELVAAGDVVFFVREVADDPETPVNDYHHELWWTDGEDATPIISLVRIQHLVAFQGALYFAGRGEVGEEELDGLWRATTGGAELVVPYESSGDTALPAIDWLTVAGDLLYYQYGIPGSTDLRTWTGSEEYITASFDFLNPTVIPAGDGVFVEGRYEPEGPQGTYWAGPSGVQPFAPHTEPVDAIEWGGELLVGLDGLSGDEPPPPSLMRWDGVGQPEIVESEFFAGAFTPDGDRLLFLGASDTRQGLWSWDGESMSPIGPSFDGMNRPRPFGTGFIFHGIQGDDEGFFQLVGDEVDFIRPWSAEGFVEFGGSLVLYGGYQTGVFEWDGTGADPQPLGDASFVYDVARTDGFLLLLDRDDEDDTYVLSAIGRPPLESIAITPTAATVDAGQTLAFTITGLDPEGESIDVTADAVLETDAPGATVAGDEITFTTAGEWKVTAEVDGLTATATVTVEPGPVASIELSPTDLVLAVGAAQQFTVTGTDAYDNDLGDLTSQAEFLSTVPGAQIGANGVVTFPEAGDGIVQAAIPGAELSVQTDVTVELGEVEAIRLTLSATSVPVGGSVTATVTGLNLNGFAIEDLSSISTLESDHDDDIDGMTVSFPSASPHAITATVVLDGTTYTDTVIVEVIPAAGPGDPDDGADGGLATSGVDASGAAAAALALLLAGLGIAWRRRVVATSERR